MKANKTNKINKQPQEKSIQNQTTGKKHPKSNSKQKQFNSVSHCQQADHSTCFLWNFLLFIITVFSIFFISHGSEIFQILEIWQSKPSVCYHLSEFSALLNKYRVNIWKGNLRTIKLCDKQMNILKLFSYINLSSGQSTKPIHIWT